MGKRPTLLGGIYTSVFVQNMNQLSGSLFDIDSTLGVFWVAEFFRQIVSFFGCRKLIVVHIYYDGHCACLKCVVSSTVSSRAGLGPALLIPGITCLSEIRVESRGWSCFSCRKIRKCVIWAKQCHFLPPKLTGSGNHTTYKNGDLGGILPGWLNLFEVLWPEIGCWWVLDQPTSGNHWNWVAHQQTWGGQKKNNGEDDPTQSKSMEFIGTPGWCYHYSHGRFP